MSNLNCWARAGAVTGDLSLAGLPEHYSANWGVLSEIYVYRVRHGTD
jgi:hypothetical protein